MKKGKRSIGEGILLRQMAFSLLAMMLAMAIIVPGAMAFSKDSLTYKKCTACHEVKDGKISRVEEIRTTPEEWAVIVDRMARLHGMDLTAKEMDVLLKELCSTQILTPEEAGKVSYLDLYNNPQIVETPGAGEPENLHVTCVRCHSAGKILSYRMTESAWKKVRDFHLYTTPTVVLQMRAMKWIPEADGVLEKLAKSHPYGQAWQAPAAVPAGSWLIVGYEPGKGNYRGQASIQNAQGGEYKIEGNLIFADGTRESFRGDATLYGGYALRTRTSHNGFKTFGAYTFDGGVIKGAHHFPAPDYRTSTSTWYPATGKAQVLRVTPGYLLSGETTTIIVEGVSLPQVQASDLQIQGGAVKVISAKRLGSELIEAQVIYQGADFRQVPLSIKGMNAGNLTLAPQIDHIAISPNLGRARVDGGKKFPAEGVQFEAIAYSKGSNASDPAAAVALGPVPATFKLTEQVTRPEDDDLRWVGGIKPNGTYLPIGTYQPISTREFSVEGIGLVKVEAEYQRGERKYAADGKLAVTVPDFIPRIK